MKTKKTALCQLKLIGDQILRANFNGLTDKKVKELQEQALEMAKEITQTFKLTDRERSNIRKAMICTMAIERELVIAATEK